MPLTEEDTRAQYIDPKLANDGWGHNVTEGSGIDREVYFTDGRMLSGGQRGKKKRADYILSYKNQKLAIVEAKKYDDDPTSGLEQVKGYAEDLKVRIVYATNGREIYYFDMETGRGDYVEQYHAPEELYRLVNGEQSDIVERALAFPFHRSGSKTPRYYQENAIMAAVRAIAEGEPRTLLTLATGTGKTFISFQIVWKLFNARWNKRGDDRRPRILFLADRNVLIEQAMGDFNALEDEIVRVNGDAIRQAGKVPTNGHIFFSIYQAMTGGGESPYYEDYPEDFFDLVIIDECHRGGANKEGNWRAVLEHFRGATHLGLTATPKREDNVDTYEYFGKPKYTYSLKAGIEDGFLTPFKVKKVNTTLDRYVYGPGDQVVEGELEKEEYERDEMNRTIVIPEREEALVRIMLREIDQKQKTIVFCMNESHAALIRDFINKYKESDDSNYCIRVTASEGETGDQWLRTFRDNEKTIPTVLTTSQKLSTGVDARNLRFVVLMRPVGSMVEFKQIVGRGTRVYEGKDFFTIVDFYENYTKFDDPDWDGDPVEVDETEEGENGEGEGGTIVDPPPTEGEPPTEPPRRKLKVQLAPHRVLYMDDMVETLYFDGDGNPVTPEEFLRGLFSNLPDAFSDSETLKRVWAQHDTREKLIDELAERGFDLDKLLKLRDAFKAEDSDVYDVLRFIPFDKEIIPRKERVQAAASEFANTLDDKNREFIQFVIDQYERNGFEEFNDLAQLLNLKYGNSSVVEEMGGVETVRENFRRFQEALYSV